MAVKAANFKLEEEKIIDMKKVAAAFHLTMTDVLNAALDAYLTEMKKDPFYRLSCNIEEASATETEEILNAIDGMTDDDLSISSVKKITI